MAEQGKGLYRKKTVFGRALAIFAALTMLTALCLPPAEAAASVQGDPMLEIASTYLAEGMDRPYAEGYMPSIMDGSALIVLPLRPADEDNAASQIRVRVDLGNPSSPFVFENYDFLVPLKTPDPSVGPLYLVRLRVPLVEETEGGRYPVAFTCSGRTDSGSFSQTFTVFVTVPQMQIVSVAPDPILPGEPAEDPDATDPEPDPEDTYDPGQDLADSEYTGDGGYAGSSDPGSAGSTAASEPTPAPQPKFMVTSVAVQPSPVTAGDPFTVSVMLENTSPNVTASNVLFTMEGDGTDVFVPDGKNSLYIRTVKPGQRITMDVGMACAPEAAPGPKAMTVHIGYDGPQGTAYTQDEQISVQITQPVRFAVDDLQIPASIQAGDTWSLPVNVMNLGRASIRNVSVQAGAPGIRAQSTLFLGTLESGSAKQGTLYAFVGPKSEAEDEARYGRTTGSIVVSCEDEFGTLYTDEVPFELEIEAPVIRSNRSADEEEETKDEQPAMSRIMSLLLAGGLAGGAAAWWFVHRAREKKRDADE